MRRFVSYGPAVLVMIVVLVSLWAVPLTVQRAAFAATGARVALARQVLDEETILDQIDRAMSAIAEAVSPSVVHIQSERMRAGPHRFGATGSGWIYDDQGHIVTNAHVVDGSNRVFIELADGRSLEGRVIGVDRSTDIAVVRAEGAEGIVPIRRASGAAPRKGQMVFAFGSPFGFKFSMSRGIISGLGRSPQAAVEFGGSTNFIQTDAAVNPGNSGGPLVDNKGRLIGMNVAIATGRDTEGTTEGQSAGISFAIPLATIEFVVDQLIQGRQPSRGFLGISLPPLEATLVPDGSFRGTGVQVAGVLEGGPAENAGLETGDIIVRIAGQRTPTVPVLQAVVGTTPPGERIDIEYWRDGEVRTVELELGEFTPREIAANNGRAALARFGLILGEDDAAPRVQRIFSPAHRLGFDAGQRIVSVGGQAVQTAKDTYVALVENGFLRGEPVTITVEDEQERQRRKVEIALPR